MAVGVLFCKIAIDAAYVKKLQQRQAQKQQTAGTDAVQKESRLATEMDTHWLENAERRQELYITSFDGLKLHTYLVARPDAPWVILCHGYTSNGMSMSYQAQRFWDRGFSVPLPDARAHGKSEGKFIGLGWPDRKDVIAWIHLLNQRFDCPPILLYGLSMGAATVMMTAGEALPSNVKAVIEDCGYSSIRDEFDYNLKSIFHLPAPLAAPILHLSSLIAGLWAGYSFVREGSCLKQLKRSRLPVLFIHGGNDTFVPTYMVDKIFAAASGCKEKLVIPGAAHAESVLVDPPLYWKRVEQFCQKHMAQ